MPLFSLLPSLLVSKEFLLAFQEALISVIFYRVFSRLQKSNFSFFLCYFFCVFSVLAQIYTPYLLLFSRLCPAFFHFPTRFRIPNKQKKILCGTFYAHFTRFDFHFPPCLSVYFSVYFSVLAEKNIHSKHISSVSTQKK